MALVRCQIHLILLFLSKIAEDHLYVVLLMDMSVSVRAIRLGYDNHMHVKETMNATV